MKIHIFDVDHTLTRRSTTHSFIKTGLKKRIIPLKSLAKIPIQWVLYKLAVIGPEFIEQEVRNYKNIPEKVLIDLSEESFFEHGKNLIYREAADLLENLKNDGYRIIAATSSLDHFIKPFMKFLGIEEYIATRLEIANGLTTGRTLGNAVFGKNKLSAVREYLEKEGHPLEETVFYSDSYNDLPLLEACGKPVAVNPDRRLKAKARTAGWECLSFRGTI